MYFADIHGQEQTKRELYRSYMAGVVPHARLFVGEDGSGALALAYAYARYINCLEPREDDACGVCRSCRSYDQFASQDLLFLFPIVNVGSRNFCEDELPQWRSFLAQGPYATYGDWLTIEEAETKQLGIFAREGDALLEKLSYNVGQARYRVVLIWLPEKMNEALGNKLLKLTEEPPPHIPLFLWLLTMRRGCWGRCVAACRRYISAHSQRMLSLRLLRSRRLLLPRCQALWQHT